MKPTRYFLRLALITLVPLTGMAQQAPPTVPTPPGYSAPSQLGATGVPSKHPAEKPFSLNFPGGAVALFVEAVEKATGEPFNVIIPEGAQDLTIPPVRVREVTLSPLLNALSATSIERKAISTGISSIVQNGRPRQNSNVEWMTTGFKFNPSTGAGGSMVWQLVVDKISPIPEAPAPTPMARFYQLKPNLEAGLKVEDIITVARSAWKMMKLTDADTPELKVHEESGILIAVGSEAALSVIESVLRELPRKHAVAQMPASVGVGGQSFPPPQASPPRAR